MNTSKLKILRITSLGYESGGAENSMVLLNPVLTNMGHTVKILSSDAGGTDVVRFNDYSFPALESQPFLLRIFYRAFYPQAYFALRRVLHDYKPDVVQLHTMYSVSPSVLFLLKKYPTIMTVHGAEEYASSLLLWAYPRNFFKKNTEVFEKQHLNLRGWVHFVYNALVVRPVYRFAFRYVDAFLVMSTYMQEKLREEGIESVCIPNATELFAYKAIEPSSKNILYVGRLEKIKGVQYLIEAMPEIVQAEPDATLTIAGAGEYRESLEELVQSLGLEESVRCVGQKSREELRLLYENSTMLVVPSVWPEPFGKVGIEAMSVGRPVIASDVGGISEWLKDGETGFLVPPKSSDAIAEKCLLLLRDTELLNSMSKQAVQHTQTFSIDAYASRVVELYEKIRKNYLGGRTS